MSTLFGKRHGNHPKKRNTSSTSDTKERTEKDERRDSNEYGDYNTEHGTASTATGMTLCLPGQPLLSNEYDPDESTHQRVITPKRTSLALETATTTATTFADLGLAESLVHVCQKILSYKQPTPVQRTMIPYLLQHPSPQQPPPPRQRQETPSQNRSNRVSRANGCVTAATGSGKTASYLLPMIHNCMIDPTTIYAIVIAPTRELATQIHQQCVLFTTSTSHNTTMISSKCVVGGCDIVYQANMLYTSPPHIVITTPGRFATILQNPFPPRNIHKISYCIIDEADRIFPATTSTTSGSGISSNCGFTSDMEIILQHIYRPNATKTTTMNTTSAITTTATATSKTHQSHPPPRLLFYSATCTKQNYRTYQQIVNQYIGPNEDAASTTNTIPLPQFIISEDFTIHDADDNPDHNEEDVSFNNKNDDNDTSTTTTTRATATSSTTTITTNIPNGLKQEYLFMPSQVRDAYLLGTIRTLLAYGGTKVKVQPSSTKDSKKKQQSYSHKSNTKKQRTDDNNEYDDAIEQYKAQSAILFVSTCERAALISELLKQVGVPNVALHSLVSTQQAIRNKVLHQFQSEYVRIIVATDIASRGLDLPRTDLVINVELTNITPMTYIHRIGRTARAGRRGRAISFVTEQDVGKVQTMEQNIGITLQLCKDMTDEIAMSMLSTTVKATRLAKLQLEQMNFHELVQKMKERKLRDQQDRKLQQKQLLTKK